MHRRILPGVIPDGTPVAQIGLDAGLRAAAKAMAAFESEALAVVDAGGGFVGIVTAGDLTRRGLAAGGETDALRVADVMTPRPDTLAPTDTALDAFALMRGRDVSCLAVVDDGKPVGVVTLGDLMTALAEALDAANAAAEAGVFGTTR